MIFKEMLRPPQNVLAALTQPFFVASVEEIVMEESERHADETEAIKAVMKRVWKLPQFREYLREYANQYVREWLSTFLPQGDAIPHDAIGLIKHINAEQLASLRHYSAVEKAKESPVGAPDIVCQFHLSAMEIVEEEIASLERHEDTSFEDDTF